MAKPRSNQYRAARAARAAQIRAARQRAIEEAARRHPDLLETRGLGGLAIAERDDEPVPARSADTARDATSVQAPAPDGAPADPETPREDGTDPAAVRRRRPTALVVFLLLWAKLLLFRLLVFGAPMPMMVVADAASVAVLVGLVGLVAPGRATRYALWALDAVVTAFLFAATLYVAHFQAVPTYAALRSAGQADGSGAVVAVLQPRFFLYFADALVVPAVWWWGRRRGRLPARRRSAGDRAVGFSVLATAGVVVSSLVVSGQSGVRSETHLAETLGPLTYQAHALLERRSSAEQVEPGSAYDQVTALKTSRTGRVPGPEDAVGFGAMKDRNLVVVQLGAFQDFPVGRSLDGQPLTPVVDRLARSGYYFPNVFQQVGQGADSDAELVTNTSLYPVGDTATSTAYGDRQVPSLPRLLAERGYRSEAFDVDEVSSSDGKQLSSALGFDAWHRSGDLEDDVSEQRRGSDRTLYATAVERAAELHQRGVPFYFHLATAGSRHPFRVPKKHRLLELPADLEGTFVGDYLQAVHDADRALGELVEGLEDAGVHDDTMIALYGDHSGVPDDEEVVDAIRTVDPGYRRGDRFNVPLVLHVPGTTSEVVDKVGGQVDVMPTLANLLGVDLAAERFVAFGSDLLNTPTHAFGVRFSQPTGSFYNDEVWFVPDSGFDDGTARSLPDLEPTASDAHAGDYDYVLDLMELSDSYVESLPPREDSQ
ncbi:LTA synthase family protein [Nocardioides sp. TF02-7]|uniref:LTA synthase family protein n=1 Tax=Nocardioides sp. TF02-7 TaxID=2917724 RepID=UPI001F0593BB|nr:LTA synthase family protein [Nocardioides sp. TF02-7]UMG94447.1 LTA synthase family protein [Nocardioides sp. TF02-7]